MENNINILRFKDGLDVVCSTERIDSLHFKIYDPMIFEVRNGNLLLQSWTPIDIVKENSTIINMNDVLCTFQPNDSFAEYYMNTLKKLNDFLKEKNNPTESTMEEEVVHLMESLSDLKNTKGTLIH